MSVIASRRLPRGSRLVVVLSLLLLGGRTAWAAPEDEPAAPPVEAPAEAAPPVMPPPMLDEAEDVADAAAEVVEDVLDEELPGADAPGGVTGLDGPQPDVRPRPPEPPPPGSDRPNWDRDWRDRDVGLGPPLVPPSPFEPRDIRYRHDTQDVSLDARVKPVKRIPQSISVVRRHDLTDWRPQDIGTRVAHLPNVMVSDGGSSPFLQIPIIRGLGGRRTRILTDGVWPATQALGINGGTLSFFDPESTERVEVFRGPGAYLRAIDSPGGLINIVPRRARRHGALSADIGASTSYDSATNGYRVRGEADVGQDRVAALIGATFTDRGDRDTGGGVLRDTGYETIAADAAVDYFLDNRSRIGFTGQYLKASNVGNPFGTFGDLAAPSYERFFAAITLTSFDAGSVFTGSKISFAIDSFLQNTDQSFLGTGQGIANEEDISRYNFHIEGNLFLIPCHDTWAELNVSYATVDATTTLICNRDQESAVVGPEGWFDDFRTVRTFADLDDCIGVSSSYSADEFLVSLLLQDEWHNDCWDVYTGFRVDYAYLQDDRSGQNGSEFLFGGCVGAAHHLHQRLTVYANASYGQRRPTVFERTTTTVIGGVTLFGNPLLDHETVINGEIGLKGSIKNRGGMQVSGFVQYIDDFINGVDLVSVGREQQLQNDGDVILYGGEVELSWRPITTIEGLELFTTMGYTGSSNERLVRAMPFQWQMGSRYSVPQPRGYRVRRWFGEAVFYGDTGSRSGLLGGDAWATADVVVGTGIHLGNRRRMEATVGVVNLFDNDYTTAYSRLPAPGLSFIASLAVDL